jgi:hypothetical protein
VANPLNAMTSPNQTNPNATRRIMQQAPETKRHDNDHDAPGD